MTALRMPKAIAIAASEDTKTQVELDKNTQSSNWVELDGKQG